MICTIVMDKSRQYIQMCKTSKEIQEKWGQTPGDLFVDINNKVSFWTKKTAGSSKIKNGFKIEEEEKVIKIEKYFWLPSLDQLMELAQVSGKSFRDTSFDFLEWSKKDYISSSVPVNSIFQSMEQLWIGYVMEKVFSKKWCDDNWEEI